MAVNIQQILDRRRLIGRIVDIVNGVPEDLLPPGFYRGNRTTVGDAGEYLRVKGTRKTATISRYGAPARHTEPVGIASTPVKLLHAYEEFTHNPTTLMNLISESGNDSMMRQQLGRETVQRQLDVFGTRFRNLRVSAVYSALATGGIAFDADGNLLPPDSSTGLIDDEAAFAIDFGVPVGNTGSLNVFGGGALLTDWTATDADILGQIKAVKKAGRKLTGHPIKYAFYGEEVPGVLLNTDQFKSMVRGSSKLAEEFADAEIPSSFGKLTWVPVDQAFFEDQDGSLKDWFDPLNVVFTPDPAGTVMQAAGEGEKDETIPSGWWEVIEGTYPVPRSIQLGADLEAVLGNIQQVAGPFSYAQIQTNPVTLQHFAGDTFLPVLKNPSAIFIAKVPVA